MNRKRLLLIVGLILLVVISVCLFLFIILPMMILPPYPPSLFEISNYDDVNHTVSVEIFNSENNSIFLESFDVKPDELFSFERGLDWCPRNRFWWLSWEEVPYTFHIMLDNTYNTSHYTVLIPTKSVWISIYLDDENPLEVFDVYTD